jgi:hypothetical protein
VAEVWMDSYKTIYYERLHNKLVIFQVFCFFNGLFVFVLYLGKKWFVETNAIKQEIRRIKFILKNKETIQKIR